MDPQRRQAILDSYDYLRHSVQGEQPPWPRSAHPDFESVDAPDFPGGRSYRGTEEVLRFFHSWTHYWDELDVQPQEFVELESGQVLVAVVLRFAGKGMQGVMEQPYTHLFDFEGERLLRRGSSPAASRRSRRRAESGLRRAR